MLSHSLLYKYDPSTGVITHRFNRSPRKDKDRDRDFIVMDIDHKINNERWMEHRLIFSLLGFMIPSHLEVDHINNIRDDNRLNNLRIVTHKNQHNRKDTKQNGGQHNRDEKRWTDYGLKLSNERRRKTTHFTERYRDNIVTLYIYI